MLIEIVGVVLGLQAFGVQQVYATPLPLTTGLIEKDGEAYPVPSPIVVEILRQAQAPWRASQLDGEVVTVEGAAILAAYAHFTLPGFIMEQIGYGFASQGMALRLCVGGEHTEGYHISSPSIDVSPVDVDYVTVIETHIDNMTGELLGGLMERLFAVGALDVTYTPIQMKKNRPASLLTVIAPVERGEQIALLLLRETSTLGVRIHQVQRRKAQREQRRIETPLGAVLVKIKRLGAQIISVAPEYEECQRIAHEQQRPLADVYEIVREAIKSAIV
jgi:uncharacterized protein (TIGR00299 family) protein